MLLPCLWVGTASGYLFNFIIHLPSNDVDRSDQSVVVSPSGECLLETERYHIFEIDTNIWSQISVDNIGYNRASHHRKDGIRISADLQTVKCRWADISVGLLVPLVLSQIYYDIWLNASAAFATDCKITQWYLMFPIPQPFAFLLWCCFLSGFFFVLSLFKQKIFPVFVVIKR